MTLKKYYLIQAVSVLAIIIIFVYHFQNFDERPKYLFIILFPLFLLSSYVAYKIDVLRSDVASHKLSKLIFLEKFSLLLVIIPLFLMNVQAVRSYIAEYYSFVYIFLGLIFILMLTISNITSRNNLTNKKNTKIIKTRLI
ncbi:hypothetical protein [Gemella sp. zg-1178]|uniref:hypothetical protein n=1 Tax=Gemella sp. zg-1178 TaxID=2840372 RepID=UPI001C03FBB2|nr:hypothetical protein [Gemella sp. zg-1178]MBU0279153.1 hypothetical protein [Gemella sp. zg-1178]